MLVWLSQVGNAQLRFENALLPADGVAPLQIAIVLEYVNGGSLGDVLQKVCPDATRLFCIKQRLTAGSGGWQPHASAEP